jgi:hypothetical protein
MIIGANEKWDSACGEGFCLSLQDVWAILFVERLSDEMDAPPPKADEVLAHSRYLPRMGKKSPLCALRAFAVNKGP